MDLEELRVAVYRSFARTGRPPRAADLAGRSALDVAAVRAGLTELARARHLVLDESGEIVMAHPFFRARRVPATGTELGKRGRCDRCRHRVDIGDRAPTPRRR